MILLSKKCRLLLSIEQSREIGQDEARKKCCLLLLLLGCGTVGPSTHFSGVHRCEGPVGTTAIAIFGRAMGLPFTNLFASCCTSPSFVFGSRFATPPPYGPMSPLMCWLLSCGLYCFAVLADRWQVILGEFPSRCTQCARSATTWPWCHVFVFSMQSFLSVRSKSNMEQPEIVW